MRGVQHQLELLARGIPWVDGTAMLLVDAILDEQIEPLEAFLDLASAHPRRERHEAELEALASVAHWGIARLHPATVAREIDWDAVEGRILDHLSTCPDATGTDLYRALGVAEATVSRAGSQLERDGLIVRARAGKWLHWRLSAEGRQAVAHRRVRTAQTIPYSTSPEALAMLDELLATHEHRPNAPAGEERWSR